MRLVPPNTDKRGPISASINARDAMPGGGRLTISTRNAASPPDHASDSNARSENWVVLGIADSGLGIDEKTRAQIFEPFFTTKPDGKCTGLGLATVYGIVKQSRGHIHVDSQPGNGTRYELYFPALDPPRRILRHQIHGSGCCLKTLSSCKSHFVLQPCWNSLNSFGADPDLLQFIISCAGNHA